MKSIMPDCNGPCRHHIIESLAGHTSEVCHGKRLGHGVGSGHRKKVVDQFDFMTRSQRTQVEYILTQDRLAPDVNLIKCSPITGAHDIQQSIHRM